MTITTSSAGTITGITAMSVSGNTTIAGTVTQPNSSQTTWGYPDSCVTTADVANGEFGVVTTTPTMGLGGYNAWGYHDPVTYSMYSCIGDATSYTTWYGSGVYDTPFYGYRTGIQPIATGFSYHGVNSGFINYEASWALDGFMDLFTWGYNSLGAQGLGNSTVQKNPTLTDMYTSAVWSHPSNNGHDVNNVRLFINTTMQSTGVYGVYASGYNGYGQLGTGNTTSKNVWTLTLIDPNSNIWNLGTNYGCTFVQNWSTNVITACGYNGHGQLGDATTTSRSTPVDVTAKWGGGTTIQKVTGGWGSFDSTTTYARGSTVMLLSDGRLFLSGYNGYGSMGNGTTTDLTTPWSPVFPTGSYVQDVAVIGGGAAAVYALMDNGDLYSWGYNGYGQLGAGNTTNKTSIGTPVATGVEKLFCDGLSAHSIGYRSTMFIRKTDGYLYAAGYNAHGQCGQGGGNVTNQTTFQRVKLPWNVRIESVGAFMTAAGGYAYIFVSDKGQFWACGYNGDQGVVQGRTTAANITEPILCRRPFQQTLI